MRSAGAIFVLQTKAFTAPLTLPVDAAPGAVLAKISSFQVRDKDGDVVLPGSFPEGVRVPMAAYGHNWDALPPGMGEITSDAEAAYFRGSFFLDTPQGAAHHATLKALGPLCEWSYSFTIADAFAGEQDGEPTRFIRKFERIFEACPVLVGAGEATATLAVKAADAVDGGKPFPNEHACRLRDPGDFQANSFRRMTRDHNGKEYSVIMGKLKGASTMTEQAYRYPLDIWTADAAKAHCSGHDGMMFEPASGGKAACGCQDADPLDTYLAAAATLHAEVKEGRVFSTANLDRMRAALAQMQEATATLQTMLDGAAPAAASNSGKGRALRLAFARIQARQLGVPV